MSHYKYFYGKKTLHFVSPTLSIKKAKNRISFIRLILKNNYGPFSETGIFQKFPWPQQQK